MTQEELDKFKAAGVDLQVRLVERVILIGPTNQANEARQVLREGHFDILESGPYTDSTMHPKCDITRYRYLVEREVFLEEGEKVS